MSERLVPQVVAECIEQMFRSENSISDLRVIDVTEEMSWNIIDMEPDNKKDFALTYENCLRFIFNNYKNKLADKIKEYHNFKSRISKLSMSRKKVGAIIRSNDNHILVVTNNKGEEFIPFGKVSDADKGFFRNTALRETGEVANIWLSEDDYKKSNRFFFYISRSQIYVVNKIFERQNVKTHSRFGEIKRTRWLDIKEFQKKFPKIYSIFSDQSRLKIDLNFDKQKAYEAYRNMEESERDFINRKKKIIGAKNYDVQFKKFQHS